MRWAALAVALAGCGDDLPERRFVEHVIDPAFRSEGVAVFDVDGDGVLDLVTEELWYRGPGFEPHEVRAPRAWDPLTEYAHCFGAFHRDVNRDGDEDLIVFGPPGEDAQWCANPRDAALHWPCAPIAAMASGESPLLVDLLGAGEVLVMGRLPEEELGWMQPAADVAAPWVMTALTPPGSAAAARYQHGLGAGDLDGDGRLDVITSTGWLEQPDDPAATPWPWHPVDFCANDCAHMFVHDVDGDGLADVLGTSPHGYGAWWWQQQPGAEPTFTRHLIDDTLSQNHAARLADLDGDGHPELVTGKRWYAHFDQDPGALEPALLVAYHYTRDGGEVTWRREIIDDDAGAGSQFEVVDVGGDGKLDVVVANKKGLRYLEQR